MENSYPTFKAVLCGDPGVGKVIYAVRFNITKTAIWFANALHMKLITDIMDKKNALFEF